MARTLTDFDFEMPFRDRLEIHVTVPSSNSSIESIDLSDKRLVLCLTYQPFAFHLFAVVSAAMRRSPRVPVPRSIEPSGLYRHNERDRESENFSSRTYRFAVSAQRDNSDDPWRGFHRCESRQSGENRHFRTLGCQLPRALREQRKFDDDEHETNEQRERRQYRRWKTASPALPRSDIGQIICRDQDEWWIRNAASGSAANRDGRIRSISVSQVPVEINKRGQVNKLIDARSLLIAVHGGRRLAVEYFMFART